MPDDDASEWYPPPAMQKSSAPAEAPGTDRWPLTAAGALVLLPFLLFYRLVEWLTEAAFRAVDRWRARQDGDRRGG